MCPKTLGKGTHENRWNRKDNIGGNGELCKYKCHKLNKNKCSLVLSVFLTKILCVHPLHSIQFIVKIYTLNLFNYI